MTCKELELPTSNQALLTRFTSLPGAPRRLLNNDFEAAWKEREQSPETHTSGFYHAWNILAVTAEITTGSMDVTLWLPAIMDDPAWQEKFSGVMQNPKSLMRMYTKRFAQTWPIYSVADVQQAGLLRESAASREDATASYQAPGVEQAPACWISRHRGDTAFLPDWQHTLSAWYMVRRNLFNSPRWADSENDTRIVSNAFLSLIYFFKESRLYFETPSMKPDIFDRTQIFSDL